MLLTLTWLLRLLTLTLCDTYVTAKQKISIYLVKKYQEVATVSIYLVKKYHDLNIYFYSKNIDILTSKPKTSSHAVEENLVENS